MACEPCKEQVLEGTCKDFLDSDCVYVSEDLTCTGVEAQTVLTTALKRIDEYICSLKNGVANAVSLINIGDGGEIYRGISNAGERELRTLTSTDGSVSITQGDETIDFTVEVDIPEVPSATEAVEGKARIATQEEVDLGEDDSTIVTPLKLKEFIGANNNVYELQIVGGNIEFIENDSVIFSEELPTGNDTFINDFEVEGTELIISRSDGEEFRKDISNLLDFTQVQSDYTQNDSGQVSYIKNRNASKTVFADYVVKPEDNTYVIVIDSANPVTISIPSTLPDKFTVGFIQKGTGLVTIANVDIIPEGFTNTIKGKGHQTFVEKIEGTKFLFGSLNKTA